MHVVFYDGECGFCDMVVQFLLRHDHEGKFLFAPLQGETAEKELADLPPEMKDADSLVLIEDYQTDKRRVSILGKGAFRIAWLMGGWWALFGWISFLPGFLYNWGYRLVARNRHRLFGSGTCVVPDPEKKGRFLP